MSGTERSGARPNASGSHHNYYEGSLRRRHGDTPCPAADGSIAGRRSRGRRSGYRGPAAHADTAPATGTPATVSADALPTWQINGVAWSQLLVGNTVYVDGKLHQGAPAGRRGRRAGEIDAQNIFAYDIRTGNPISASTTH